MTATYFGTEAALNLTRDDSTITLNFRFNRDLVNLVKTLPYAQFNSEKKYWTTFVCKESFGMLQEWFDTGKVAISPNPNQLLLENESPPNLGSLVVLPYPTAKHKYLVLMAHSNDRLFKKLRDIPSSAWDKNYYGFSFGEMAITSLLDLHAQGTLSDPKSILMVSKVVVSFDTRVGKFTVRGNDSANSTFAQKFPALDVVGIWQSRGIDVGFDSKITEEVYYGELARNSDGIQPDGLLLPLYSHQAREVSVAVERTGFGIFDAPGIGKTATAIGVAHEVMNNRNMVDRTIIVVPGAVRTHWGREITRFTGNEDIVIIQGDLKSRVAAYEKARASRWLVVHYDILHRDLKFIAPLAIKSLLIADEAHRLRTPTTNRAKAMKSLGTKAARRLALSGTPVENNPGEWFSVLSNFAIPGIFGSPISFLGRYQYPGKFGGFEGARNLDELQNRSCWHYMRHTKADVASHLPPLVIQHMPLDPDPGYAAALALAHKLAKAEIKQAMLDRRMPTTEDDLEELISGSEMTAVGMLRLMCSSPRLVEESSAAAAKALRDSGLVPNADGPKVDSIRELARQLQENLDRVVVFSFSKSMVNLVARRLEEDKVTFVKYTGDTSFAEREAAVLAFTTPPTKDNPGPTVFLATDAAAEGLNLGLCASTLVNLDIPWTPSRLEQRSNRIHRIDGTQASYRVINYTVRGTIESGILNHVEKKADLTDAIFGESGGRARTTGRKSASNYWKSMLINDRVELLPEDEDYLDEPLGFDVENKYTTLM